MTISLYDALMRLRYGHIERTVWADAVCINQGDVEERDEQVRQMAKIYAAASRVIVWLGGTTADSAQSALEDLRVASAEPPGSHTPRDKQDLLSLLGRD